MPALLPPLDQSRGLHAFCLLADELGALFAQHATIDVVPHHALQQGMHTLQQAVEQLHLGDALRDIADIIVLSLDAPLGAAIEQLRNARIMAAKLTKDELLDLGLSEECAIRLAESEEQSKELGKELKLAMARIKELEEQAKARVAAEQEAAGLRVPRESHGRRA
ncbi:helix-turn-helix-type transcriptional regulator isoform A [Micractinium conductrix]|uniref:Helix-turn-helix-type transcriptional regulator isoform A n=1 Tax=Micractinium conductrix TaxID=554055 RepID=A0A2P6V7J6_9CHLO|nr:helix-turn-helix-type transcriptional regulator isoform A [Micractinium conductrix]|eukprot:PSC70057.1 helix-turn-helix-type transcriptional regulator isoform A [Micractinium conductrix]